ncbi:biofilm PGA synthesis lipoprotein PgaB [Luteibacter sp. UNC138MFCol5.1]|uniref:poly-beta-1,6-N-acetyl-D-glucosamine N-deacetylase PgaB n=1 Tax=Luteibacter sp. UNC138MFCol5.1 TaxID=1502774 RepID=UPI0008CE9D3A|nr:poly-beta-1,6-N-acetyl-D-glucosamine N-deacetylase PgaB [Luteibacter sp. UNC138MFCol5.1]SEO74650.1 biofilm PGA synthesis lipoprotein PgaB [Luteibacter sp. UNC138MFCol5.1]
MRPLLILLALLGLALPAFAQSSPEAPARPALIVLGYHDIRDDVRTGIDRDPDALSTDHLIAHFDWLKANGYNVVSLQQVVDATNGGAPLPRDAVLLTFDDGLVSFYTRVYPLLRAYHYPAVQALVGSWMDMPAGQRMPYNGADCDRSCFLSWEQVEEMQKSGLVEFASHSWQMHQGMNANPQGNLLPTAAALAYDATKQRYETVDEYKARIRADLSRSADEIEKHTGVRPRAVAWPYGAYTQIGRDVARDVGMPVTFSLGDKLPTLVPGKTIPRILVSDNVTANRLGWLMRHSSRIDPTRAVQIDLDYVYDPDPAQQDRNLSKLLDRIKRLHPSQVWLQAYSDPDGDGVADAVYFPNRHLPVRADLFSRVSWQLRTRAGVRVYAWMPVLAFRFPQGRDLPSLGGEPKAGGDHFRLAPYDPKVRAMIGDVYEDLAMHADEAGVLFSDDAYIRDTDRLGPWAKNTAAQNTQALIDFTLELATRMKRWRPQLLTARNLFTRPIVQPKAEAWFAQSLPAFNKAYDMTAVMAMPQLDKQADTLGWYRKLVDAVAATPDALEHTLFEFATQDWRTKQPIPDAALAERMRAVQAKGARHIGYYPDDFIRDHPALEAIRPTISASDYPYPEPAR